MTFESPLDKRNNFLETIRQKVREKINLAKQHSLDVIKDEDFLEQYEKKLHQYYDTELEDPELESMSDRIQESMVQAETFVEFKVILEELGLSKAVVLDYVEHENAHVNVMEQESAYQTTPKYGVLLLSRAGEVVVMQPLAGSEKVKEASMLDFLKSSLRSTQAPRDYGHELSEGDMSDIKMYETLIAKKEANKETNKDNIS